MIHELKQSFLGQLIDWKEFELFVAELYKSSDEVIVSHNVTEVGKSQAKRQIDVLIVQKMGFHSIKVIIECKRWKHKVDRQVIDVLASSVEDLNANKGVIFTTKGYEEGAIQYAKSKNIDIFVIRDVADNEWGEPGRKFFIYLQMFNGKFENFNFKGLKFFSHTGQPPRNTKINLSAFLTLEKNQKFSDELQLFSIADSSKGPNLLNVLINVRQSAVQELFNAVNGLIAPEDAYGELAYRRLVNIDFTGYPFSYIKHEEGYIQIEGVSFNLLHSITQSKMEFDRTASSDFVLIVENYITNQRHFVSKSREETGLRIAESKEQEKVDEDKILKNGAVLKISTDYFVDVTLKPETKIQNLNDLNVAFSTSQ